MRTIKNLYRANNFFVLQSTVRLLVSRGATVDLQSGAGKGNATGLAFAAQQGHLHVIKALVELGASPDVKGMLLQLLCNGCEHFNYLG